MKKHALLLLASISLFGGCTDHVRSSFEPPDEQEPVPDDTVFYETVVTLGPDGPQISEPRPITAASQREQNQLRLAIERGEVPETAYRILDGACDGASLWLFSRMDWTGDKICFRGCGSMILRDLIRYVNVNGQPVPIGYWESSTGSYWPGADRGVLVGNVGSYGSSWIPFSAWGTRGRFNLGGMTIDGIGVGYTVQGELCPD